MPGCAEASAPGAGPALVDVGAVVANEESQAAVAGLPFAQGRTFTSLDDYLEFRRSRGTSDVPWYREIKPGTYELISRRGPGAERKFYTREELARKFGFNS